jgi:hypothetical protein
MEVIVSFDRKGAGRNVCGTFCVREWVACVTRQLKSHISNTPFMSIGFNHETKQTRTAWTFGHHHHFHQHALLICFIMNRIRISLRSARFTDQRF